MATEKIIGYDIDISTMKNSTCGTIGIAEKHGEKYFCKRFSDPVEPDRSKKMMSEAVADMNQKKFDLFVTRKKRVNTALREISGRGGNIVCPLDEVIHDHHLMEFSEYVEGAVDEKQYSVVIAELPEEKKLLVLKIAVGALQTLHSRKIVHGDLQLANILLVKNDAGNYVSKIIDFDGAFFEDDVPLDSITGTPDYYSPELAVYSFTENPEDRRKLTHLMTTKSDIFTMGLILHEYLTGHKPEPDGLPSALQKVQDAGRFVYPWQVLLTRDKGKEPYQLKISREIKEKAYVALISDMLCCDPEYRPSAAEVLSRLNSRTLPIESEGWPEDQISIDTDEAGKTLVALRKREETDKDGVVHHFYEIVNEDGLRFRKTKEELIDLHLARPAEVWEDPWAEDKIELDTDKLKLLFLSFCRGEKPGMYRLYDKKGSARHLSSSQLKMVGLARQMGEKTSPSEKVPSPETARKTALKDGLWKEDHSQFCLNQSLLDTKNLNFQGACSLNGVKGYQFMDPNGTVRFLPN